MPDNVGNTLSTALQITLGSVPKSFTDSAEFNDNDYYRFTLTNRSSFNLSLTGLGQNADVEVLSGAGAIVTDADGVALRSINGGTLVESINTILDPGTYYIRVLPGPPNNPLDPANTTPSTNYSLNVLADNGIRTDIIWQNQPAVQAGIWRMNNTSIESVQGIPSAPSSSWKIVGAGDFTGDGEADLVFRDQASGSNGLWQLVNGSLSSVQSINAVADTSWEIGGVADFNQDGNADLLWHNRTSGGNGIWLMTGAAILSVVSLPTFGAPTWQIQGIGDMNGDGQQDILWRNVAPDGVNAIWLMNGAAYSTAVTLVSEPDLNKQMQGTGDFNGDGSTDILWRNFSTGANEVWLMNGTARSAITSIPAVEASWQAVTPYRRLTTPTLRDIAGNTTGQALAMGPLNGNAVYRDFAGTTDTDDYYQFSLGSRTTFNLALTGLTGSTLTGNLDVQVLTNAGAPALTITPQSGNAPESATGDLAPGNYFIRVFAQPGSNSAYQLSLSVNNQPVLATNLPLSLGEGAEQTIARSLLLVTDENNPPEQLTYTLITPPNLLNGNLSLGGAAITTGNTFTQADINNNRLTYRQSGSEAATDSFVFAVSDGLGGQVPNTTFSINVAPANDPPSLLTNLALTVSEGAIATIASSSLLATDPEQSPAQLIYSLAGLPTNGALSLNGTALSIGSTFSQAAINNNQLTYRHNGSESTSDSFTFSVADGAGGIITPATAAFSISVAPVNDPPVLVSNQALTLSQGQSASISQTLLRSTDAEFTLPSQLDLLVYTVTTPPTRGTLFLNGTQTNTFTQADVNNGRLLYNHNESSTNSDRFTFTVSDGVNTTQPATFEINVNAIGAPPVLISNTGLTLSEGTAQTITNTALRITDLDSPPPSLLYTLGSSPLNGQLRRSQVILTVGQTFSQQDIDTGRIDYLHNGSETVSDRFTFTASDGTVLITPQTFSIGVTPVNDPPTLVSNTGITIAEGSTTLIASTLLNASDPDNLASQVVYTITNPPTSGTLLRAGTLVSQFTQADLNGGQIRYQHNGSESISDSFTFDVTDGAATPTPGTFNVSVIPVNDLPSVAVNTPTTLDEGTSATFNDSLLQVTDGDGPGPITYTLGNGPNRGTLLLSSTPLSVGGTFTQDDITNGRVTYTHNGSETTSDSFAFTVSDSGGGNVPLTTYNFSVTPVNDAPIITVPPSPLAVNEDTALVFTGTNRITVSDADAGSSPVQVTLRAIGGTINLGSVGGLTVNGNGTGSVDFTGSLSAVNSALNNLSYRGTQDFNGLDTLTITVNDQGATGSGASGQDTRTIDINVIAVNDAPTLTVPAAESVNEDATLSVIGITVADVDAGNTLVRGAVSATNGTLTLNTLTGLSFTDNTANGSNSLSFTGTIADIQNALGSLTYQGNPNYFGGDAIAITINDEGATGGNPLGVTRSIPVTVVPVNDQPTFTGGSPQQLLEDSGAQTVSGWATGISRGAPNESGQILTFNVTNDNAALFTVAPRVDPATGNLTYTLAPNANGVANVSVTLRDNGGTTNGGVDTSDPYTFTITVDQVNDAPSFTRGANITVAEDAAPQTINNWATNIQPGPITPAANEAAQAVNFLVDSSNPSLFSAGPEIAPNGSLTYTLAPNANGTAVVTVRLQDNGGTENGGVDTSAPQTFTINVTPVNDAPVLTVPGAQIVDEDTSINLAGVSITDVDAGNGSLRVTLSAPNGNLTLGSATGLQVTGNNSSNVSIVGTLANINTALGGLTYQGRTNFNGSDNLIISVNDQGNTGGTPLTDTRTVGITVNAVNDAPVLTVSSGVRTVPEDTDLTLSGITVTDLDAGTGPIQVTASALNGIITFVNTTGVTVTGNGTGQVTLTGDLTAVRNTAFGASNVRYRGNPNYNGPDTVTLTVNDQGNTGLGGPLTDTKTLSVNVTAVNDPPLLTVPGAQTVAEDEDLLLTDVSGITVTDIDSGTNSIRATLSVNNGVITLASTDGLTIASGSNASRSVTVTGTADAIATALSNLTYRGNPNYNGSDRLTVIVNDQGFTGAGGAQTVTRTVDINVTSVNDLPVLLSNSSLTLSEGTSRIITNGLLRATDVDNTAAQVVYTLQTATSPGRLLLGGATLAAGGTFTQSDIDSSRLTYVQGGSESLSDSFVFRISDGGTPLPDATFNIVVNPINDPPSIISNQPLTLSEGNTSTISNTLLRVTDPDNTTAQLRYTITSAPTSGNVRLVGTNLSAGQTFTQADLDSGRISYRHNGSETTSDSFTFAVSDGSGSQSGVFSIAVTSVNDAPVVLSSGPLSINEGAITTITNSIIRTTDPDTLASNLLYTIPTVPVFGTLLRSGTTLASGAVFSQQDIDNGLITYQHNGSESTQDVFVFQVSDGVAPAVNRIVNITIRPVNDTPVLVNNTGITLDGNTPTTVGISSSQLQVTDVDNTATELRYTLNSTPNPAVGVLRLNGTELGAGNTFTQADVDSGNLTYQYFGGGSSDNFQFTVSDGGTGGTLPANFFDISFIFS